MPYLLQIKMLPVRSGGAAAPQVWPTVCTDLFCFFFLLWKSTLFIEIIQKPISKLRRCFPIIRIIGGTYGAEELQMQIYYKQDAPLEQLPLQTLVLSKRLWF